MRNKYAILAEYSDDWPIRDMLKLHLKGKAQTARSAQGREAAEAMEQVSVYRR